MPSDPLFEHLLDTYVSEMEKTAAVWRHFSDADLGWKPHPKSSTVGDIFKHQLLSERRFFSEFIGINEPAPTELLPPDPTVAAYIERLLQQSKARLQQIEALKQEAWLATVKFFGEDRRRIWVFWRRVLHTAHHRTQLTIYLRLLDKTVPSVYGPTADVTWAGADPTQTVEAAGRK